MPSSTFGVLAFNQNSIHEEIMEQTEVREYLLPLGAESSGLLSKNMNLKIQGSGEDYIRRSFMVCTSHRMQ